MSDGHLIWGFLDLNLLEADKLAGLDLHYELSFSLVLLAAGWGALNLRSELTRVDDLINFKAADVAGVNCNLDARFDITAASNNTLYID